VVRLVLEIDEFTMKGLVAFLAVGASPICTVSALSMTVLRNELSAQFLATLNALEATSMPSLSESSKYGILNGSMAAGTVFPFHAFIVIWLSFQNQILASDTTVTLGARHELTSTIRAVHLVVVVVVGSQQSFIAFSASEVILMVRLAPSSHVFGAVERVVALSTMGVGSTSTSTVMGM